MRKLFLISFLISFLLTHVAGAAQAPVGVFNRIVTQDPSSQSAVIAGGIIAGSQRNQIVDFSGRIPALTPQYFVSLDGSQLNNVTVGALQGRTVCADSPSNLQVLTWLTADNCWKPQTPTLIAHNLLSSAHSDTAAASPVLGDLIAGNNSPAWQRVAGNITTAKQFLSQTGNGTISALPVWAALLDADVPDTITLANLTQITTRSHSSLQDLTADDHTIYALLAGRSGGQTLIGGTAASNSLTLQSTSHGTKGKILFGTSAYDEVNNRLGVGTDSPSFPFQTGLNVSGVSGFFTIANIAGTVSSADFGSTLTVSGTWSGAGDGSSGLFLNPTHSPVSGSVTRRGLFATPTFNPGVGATIAAARVLEFSAVTGSGAGAITELNGIAIGGPSYGTIKPTTVVGLKIFNQGSASITTAISLEMLKPTNASNNYYMSFDTADGTTCTIAGRLPVLIGGVAHFIPYC